tara:strand:- start:1871 stop:2068 length:198 start_codon:yes stop_codon:yes gene_type:complete
VRLSFNIGGIMDTNTKNALNDIIDMYYEEEKKHWIELFRPDDHIFIKLDTMKHYLRSKKNGNSHR